jgi:hypothetical protein
LSIEFIRQHPFEELIGVILTIRRLGLVLALVACSGCGSDPSKRPEILATARVNGTLTYKGQPLKDHQVVFTPTDGKRPALGRTDAEGKFSLGTNKPGDGAPVGTHKVSVNFDPPSEVDSVVANPIDNPAQMQKPEIEIPAKYGHPDTSGLTQEVPKGGLTDLKIDLE